MRSNPGNLAGQRVSPLSASRRGQDGMIIVVYTKEVKGYPISSFASRLQGPWCAEDPPTDARSGLGVSQGIRNKETASLNESFGKYLVHTASFSHEPQSSAPFIALTTIAGRLCHSSSQAVFKEHAGC